MFLGDEVEVVLRRAFAAEPQESVCGFWPIAKVGPWSLAL